MPHRVAGAVIGIAALLIACGGPTKSTSSDDFAKSFDIGGGRQMYLECRGTGSPTVVLVSGAVAAGDTWSDVADPSGAMKSSESAVYPQVGKFTRVCAYDRPGTVRTGDTFTSSTPVPQPTTPAGDAADLHALLVAAAVSDPYVLVGWSFGGPIARIYASTYPHDVSGLVLVDGTSEFLQTELSPAEFAVFLELTQGDDAKRVSEWADVERFDVVTSFAQLRAAPPAPAMPVAVLSGDKFDADAFRARLPAGAPVDYPETFWRAQLASQASIATLFPGAQHITNTNSGHNVHNESPQLVIDAIRDVVDQVGH